MTGMQTADSVVMRMGREVMRLPHLRDEGKVGGEGGRMELGGGDRQKKMLGVRGREREEEK